MSEKASISEFKLKTRLFDPDVPKELFTEEEYDLLVEYGSWLTALMYEVVVPTTEKQKHFVKVCKGHSAPKSFSDHTWLKFIERKCWEEANPEYANKESKIFADLGIVSSGWGIYGRFK